MKQVYRHGLAERYGKTMQMIAGIHYNISFSQALFESLWRYDGKSCSLAEYTNQRYMGLVRNFFVMVGYCPIYLVLRLSPVEGQLVSLLIFSRHRGRITLGLMRRLCA